MIKVTKTFIRPNASVVWWITTPAGQNYVGYRQAMYGSKISNQSETHEIESSDGLTWTFSATWDSRADYDAMMADPNIQQAIAARRAYDGQNGIYEADTQIVNL